MSSRAAVALAILATLLVSCTGTDSDLTAPTLHETPGPLLVSDLLPGTQGGPGPTSPHAFASLPAGSIPGGT
ncbi:MAG TPA: hypothetical protein VFD73_25020, partial [Gemmatimonadales bacterium]|nr:hypothetical protein [Gemmatimonadales bacterium]